MIQRRTPLKRTALKRSQKPIRRVSKRRAKQLRVYSVVCAEYKAAHPICEKCREKPTDDVHHKAGRIGEKLNDKTQFIAVCRTCHDEIHQNPNKARSLSLLK